MSEGGRPSSAPFYRRNRRRQAARAIWDAPAKETPMATNTAIRSSVWLGSNSVWAPPVPARGSSRGITGVTDGLVLTDGGDTISDVGARVAVGTVGNTTIGASLVGVGTTTTVLVGTGVEVGPTGVDVLVGVAVGAVPVAVGVVVGGTDVAVVVAVDVAVAVTVGVFVGGTGVLVGVAVGVCVGVGPEQGGKLSDFSGLSVRSATTSTSTIKEFARGATLNVLRGPYGNSPCFPTAISTTTVVAAPGTGVKSADPPWDGGMCCVRIRGML
ncbi:MAG: hypothetical protein A2Z24_00130 [Candidatus Woykebacteria bacterium RBG_16_44_10]|uniref:Uncharacterized protein n=1 Tax=Candidatus Woykebacteria bacterium RBG_16_44_10 TaxID=1802597 RepID=A0A1G1WFR9_9BACT|nr:MAG: hypothetical protein A2Z24_00130 [Candidatus Woykebacteria bacterium RBG_16_44_10]